MLRRVREWYDGSGWYVGLATVLLIFTMLWVVAQIESPDIVLWTGHRVNGTEQHGIVYYHWHGQPYSIDMPGSYTSARTVSVYLDPANPYHAMVDSPVNRAIADAVAVVPFAGVIALLAAGPVRNYRRRRRKRLGLEPSGFGKGLDADFVSNRLEELRRGPHGGRL